MSTATDTSKEQTMTITAAPATTRQAEFLASLIEQAEGLSQYQSGEGLVAVATITRLAPTLDKAQTSRAIDAMKQWIEFARTVRAMSGEEPVSAEVPEGMHRLDGSIYKVQKAVHGSGRLYAKRLVKQGEQFAFEYAAGSIRRLSEATKMTLEEAKEFGHLYGTCCVCGATLTDEHSIEAGIGPVCARKF